MNLPNDFARCDGLLPKTVTMPNGMLGKLWAIDCPKRDTCARHQQMHRDDPTKLYTYTAHSHAPTEPCQDFIQEQEQSE